MKTLALCRVFVLINLLALPLAAAEFSKAPSTEVKDRGSILGVDLKAIQAALPVFEKKGMKVDDYRVRIIEEEYSIFVIFEALEASAEQIGKTEGMAPFQVQLTKTHLTVIASFGPPHAGKKPNPSLEPTAPSGRGSP